MTLRNDRLTNATSPPSDQADGSDAEPGDQPTARKNFVLTIVIDIALPLAVFYGLRALGVDQWWALILSGIVPIVRLGIGLVRHQRIEGPGLFTLSLLVVGTLVGFLTGDPRLLVARESYLTAIAGLWILATHVMVKPFMFTVTLPLLPPETRQEWHNDWQSSRQFRRVLRLMTVGWGLAFIIDAAARVVLAYTIPLDLVPVIGIALMVAMLVAVTQGTKAWAKRLTHPTEVES